MRIKSSLGLGFLLKFRRVTIRGAQPSARLSEEICLSEGSAGVSQRALRGLSEGSAGSLRGFCGALRGSRDFPRFFEGSDPMLPEGPTIKKIQSRSIFDPDQNF